MNYFVTGGSRGIGAEIVRQAIREGHDVAFTYVGNEEAARGVVAEAREIDPERKCRTYRMDVRDSAEVEGVGDQVLDDFEDIHVVVNNAGITRDNIAAYMSDEEWSDVLATNLSGPFYVARHFLPGMMSNRYGRIINIGSVAGTGSTGQVNYASAKAGLVGLTKSLAKEYGPRGVTCNVILAGWFETDLTKDEGADAGRDYWLQLCPKRRFGKLEEIAKVVTFLGTEASEYVNGAEIPITGGLERAP